MTDIAFIYVIGTECGPVKIGYAADPKKRCDDLQVGCPDDLIVHYTLRVQAHLAEDIERHVHQALAAHRRRGEWFNIGAEEAYEIVQREGLGRTGLRQTLAHLEYVDFFSLQGLERSPSESARCVADYALRSMRPDVGDDLVVALAGVLQSRQSVMMWAASSRALLVDAVNALMRLTLPPPLHRPA